MENRSRIRGIVAIGLAAILTLALALASAASASTRSIAGHRAGSVVTFKVRPLRGTVLVKAHVVIDGRRYPISVAALRRAVHTGKLKVRVAKRKPAKSVRKMHASPVVVVSIGTPVAAAPAPAPAPSVTSTPAAPAAPVVPPVTVSVDVPATVITPPVTTTISTSPPAPVQEPAPAPAPAQEPAAPAPVLVVVVAPPAPDPAPAPESAPAAAPCSAALSAFVAGAGPPACWRPYADDSPWNRRISANPEVLARSGDYIRQLTKIGAPDAIATGNADTTKDWAHPTYYAQASDPLYTLHCTESWGTCAIEGLRVRVPSSARPAGGSDGHLTIVDIASGWEYDLWGASPLPSPGGTIRTMWGGKTRIDGDGLNSDATAARFGNLAGMIRAPELAAGRIEHALFMTYPCGLQSWSYPAAKGGAVCPSSNSADAFPMGTRFQLNMSDAEIDALGFATWKTAILKAMAHYGMYFGDTGGHSWAVMTESSSSYTSFGLADPLLAIARSAGYSRGSDGIAWMNLGAGVNWTSRLRALAPCTARGTC